MEAIFITFLVTSGVMLPAGAYLHFRYGASLRAEIAKVETRVREVIKK